MKDIRGRTELGGRFWALRRFLLWGLLGVAVLAAAVWAAQLWWHWMYPVAQFRYKLTVEVMTPDGLKSGSSVIEVSYQNVYSLSGVPNLRLTARGEAVFLPMGGKRLFAVTLTDQSSGRYQPQIKSLDLESGNLSGALDVYALPLKTSGVSWKKYDELLLMGQVNSLSNQKRRFSVPFENLPTLVVFEDVNSPDSVKVVQPDNLSAAIGVGYALKDVWLEITDEQPTNTDMKQFPWWEVKVEEWRKNRFIHFGDEPIDILRDGAFKLPRDRGMNYGS